MLILGLSIGILAFPLGFAVGFNFGSSLEVKKLKKLILLKEVVK